MPAYVSLIDVPLFFSASLAMRLFLAIFLPCTVFFTIGRPFAGVLCLLLQITVLGWLGASIWAVYAHGEYKTDQKINQALRQR